MYGQLQEKQSNTKRAELLFFYLSKSCHPAFRSGFEGELN
jgi:hypothetical protein